MQNYTVESLVNKYNNSLNPIKVGRAGYDTDYGKGEELLACLYAEKIGSNMQREMAEIVVNWGNNFNEDALTKEEYDFLLEHFSEAVEYIINTRCFTDVYEHGVMPASVTKYIIESASIPAGSRIFLPNAGYGDAIMMLRDSNITGFVNGAHAWAIIQIRMYAADIKADIECIHNYFGEKDKAKEPKLPSNGSVDFVITSHEDFNSIPVITRPLPLDYIPEILKDNGSAIIITDGYALCGKKNAWINKSLLSKVIQFPHKVSDQGRRTYKGICAVVYVKNNNGENVEFIDYSTFTTYSVLNGKKTPEMFFNFGNALQSGRGYDGHVKVILKSQIDNDIYLPTYYQKSFPKYYTNLSTIASVGTGDYVRGGNMLVVTADDLTSNFADSAIDYSKLSTVKDLETLSREIESHKLITKPCVVFSICSEGVKVGCINNVPSSGILLDHNVLSLIPHKGISIETIAILLLSDYVQRQFISIRYVWTMNNDLSKYLKKIKIFPEVYNDDVAFDIEMEAMAEQAEAENRADEAELDLMEELANAEKRAGEADLELMYELAHTEESYQSECIDDDSVFDTTSPESMAEESYQSERIDDDSDLDTTSPESMIEESYQSGIAEDDYYSESVADVEDLLRLMDKESLIDMIKTSKINELQTRNMLVQEIKNKNEELKRQHSEYEKNIRLRKHALSQTVSSLSSMFNSLNTYRSKKDGVLKDSDIISRVKGTTVADVFEVLSNGIQEIERKVSKIADVEMNWGEPERLIPEEFIDTYIQQNVGKWQNFIANTEWHGNKQKQASNTHAILMPPKAFRQILDNIISNAISHAFTDNKKKDYKLKFATSYIDNKLIVEISNNGNPLPSDINPSLLKNYGYSGSLDTNGHDGAGCHEIDVIMKNYGYFEITPLYDGEFTVKYKLSFTKVR